MMIGEGNHNKNLMALAQASLNGPVKLQKQEDDEKIIDFNEANRMKNMQDQEKHRIMLKQHRRKRELTSGKAKKTLATHDLFAPGTKQSVRTWMFTSFRKPSASARS